MSAKLSISLYVHMIIKITHFHFINTLVFQNKYVVNQVSSILYVRCTTERIFNGILNIIAKFYLIAL